MTKEALFDKIDNELKLRKKEIESLSQLVSIEERPIEKIILAKLLCISIYGNIEKFFKTTMNSYLDFLKINSLIPIELKFFAKAYRTRKNLAENFQILNDIYKGIYDHHDIDDIDKVQFEYFKEKHQFSNEILNTTLMMFDLNYEPYLIIPQHLLKKYKDDRNKFAHGNYIDVLATIYNENKDLEKYAQEFVKCHNLEPQYVEEVIAFMMDLAERIKDSCKKVL